jgi:hypothetical protein
MAQAGEPHRPLDLDEGFIRRNREELAAHEIRDRRQQPLPPPARRPGL